MSSQAKLLCGGIALGALMTSMPAMAEAQSGADVNEIVVTARKREETSISVPVAITALNQEMLDRQGIRSLSDVALIVPSLSVGQVSSGIGGTIVLRGVGTAGGSNPSFDQTVTTNIDGVQLSRGSVQRLGQLDLGTLEVLRGPQALFFGKNSPAGVISFRSADPTDRLEMMMRGSYEAVANERTLDGFISGPITDNLKVRLAASISGMDGWMINDASKAAAAANAIRPDSVFATTRKGPQSDTYFVRGTVLFDPVDRLSMRLKLSYSELNGIMFQHGANQRIFCPNGSAQTGAALSRPDAFGTGLTSDVALALAAATAVDDCKADNHYTAGDINPSAIVDATTGEYAINDVDSIKGGSHSTMFLGSAELNYELSDALMLTSVSGYARMVDEHYDTFSYSPADPTAALRLMPHTRYIQKSQELRLATDFDDSPVNGVVGFYYEKSDLLTYTRLLNGDIPPTVMNVEGDAISAFGQLMWDVTPELELSGGARWTKESKDYSIEKGAVTYNQTVDSVSFSNLSPEATLTWRPSADLTAYASYRMGFKSGGFATPYAGGSVPPAPPGVVEDQTYRPEKVRGGEVGLKMRIMDGQIRLNIGGYYYNYSNLQVNSLDNSSGLPSIKVTNAAKARIKGLEADFVYRPLDLPGFDIHGAANYGQARYTNFDTAPCGVGQTIDQGCNLLLNSATGRFTAQDLSGRPLLNAPDFSGSLGFSYTGDLGDSGLTATLSPDIAYKSSYESHPDLWAEAVQKRVAFLNMSARVNGSGWEFAVIGKNLTDKYRTNTGSQAPFSGNSALTGTNISGGMADLTGYVNRGRQVTFQVTLRPSEWGR